MTYNLWKFSPEEIKLKMQFSAATEKDVIEKFANCAKSYFNAKGFRIDKHNNIYKDDKKINSIDHIKALRFWHNNGRIFSLEPSGEFNG